MTTLIAATVKYPAGRTIETQYGDKINAVVTTHAGEEVKLWGRPGDATLTRLKKGEKIQLLHDGKKYTVLEMAANIPSPQPTEAVDWTDEQKKAIARKIAQRARLLRYCYDQAAQAFEGAIADPVELRAIATTLFIEALRK